MTLATRIAARRLKLRPAHTHRVGVHRDLAVPTSGGTVSSLADRYYPRDDTHAPLVIATTAWSAHGLIARLIAERGYQVLVVAAENGGTARDQALRNWLHRQPWYPRTITEFGPHALLTDLLVVKGPSVPRGRPGAGATR